MNTSKGATARFGVAAVIALGVTLTTAHAQDYSNCPAQSRQSKATRDARTPCPAERQDDAYLQWALDTHRAALGSIYLTAQNPVAPRDTRTRDGRICACGIPLSP
jgi:hypothetical protein